jgi:hypothetical protein
LTFEAFNTVVEALTDLFTDRFHPLAKVAKDTRGWGCADRLGGCARRGHRGLPAQAARLVRLPAQAA